MFFFVGNCCEIPPEHTRTPAGTHQNDRADYLCAKTRHPKYFFISLRHPLTKIYKKCSFYNKKPTLESIGGSFFKHLYKNELIGGL